MADSRRQTIVTALKTILQTIQVANGYETNAGLNVFEWRGYDIPEAKLPAIDLRDGEELPKPEAAAALRHEMIVEINCFAADPASPAVLRKIMADVIKAIGADPAFPRIGGVAEDVTFIQQGITEIEHDERFVTAGQVGITIEWMTGHFDPYQGGN